MTTAAIKQHGKIDAVVSTDGDSDRPLVLGVDGDGRVKFYGGDLVGMVVAEYLRADAVVVPISSNDAIDRGTLKEKVQPKTKIGSPFVITGMAEAEQKRSPRGGRLGSERRFSRRLSYPARRQIAARAADTRCRFYPFSRRCSVRSKKTSRSRNCSNGCPVASVGPALLRKFPRAVSLQIVARFSPASVAVADIYFESTSIRPLDIGGKMVGDVNPGTLWAIKADLERFFTADLGFGKIVRLNYTDGVRIYFANGDVAHVRPSGNADELRIYAVADTQPRADEITSVGVREPDGILRNLERAVTS